MVHPNEYNDITGINNGPINRGWFDYGPDNIQGNFCYGDAFGTGNPYSLLITNVLLALSDVTFSFFVSADLAGKDKAARHYDVWRSLLFYPQSRDMIWNWA